jgi:MarR family transcriptional regulator, lower aerobic nicotinate degradation pathway regulator
MSMSISFDRVEALLDGGAGDMFLCEIIFVKINYAGSSRSTMTTMDDATASRHPLADDLDWLLNRAWLGFGETRADAIEPLGISVREHVLLRVLRGSDATQLEAGATARVDKSVLTTTIDSLEAKGLVVREVDPADRRVRRPRLTPEGNRICRAADTATRAAQEARLDHLTPAQREEFVRILRVLAFEEFAESMLFSQTADRPRGRRPTGGA